MSDIIELLPDHVANQIAAGEVIQRPASAVKELLENAIDAGGTKIELIIEDAGKALLQVIDNGKGMSETDARLCFERHATSKIKKIDDLFNIRTMGFRGEALASIAAVAQVFLKTKTDEREIGTEIYIENSSVISQEQVATVSGTSIAMKNLFFNVPARRNFLKSNSVELKHIVDEFIRVALSFPEVHFEFSSNGQQQFFLEKGNLKQRIIQLFGNNYNNKLIQVKEQTDYLNIFGFVGKPEAAKKTRGEQYFFVNNRFIKSAYLNHATVSAYDYLLAKDSFPFYVLFIDLDPNLIDINVHPTKQEIKFDDEKIVYAFIQSAIKHALAQHSMSGSIEFDIDKNIAQSDAVALPFTSDKKEQIKQGNLFNTFTRSNQAHKIEYNELQRQATTQFYTPNFDNINYKKIEYDTKVNNTNNVASLFLNEDNPVITDCYQWNNDYIIYTNRKSLYIINQQNAHERILYDKYKALTHPIATQQSLFPESIVTSPSDTIILTEALSELLFLGYLIEPFGNNTFIIQGTPNDILQKKTIQKVIEDIIEQLKMENVQLKLTRREKIIISVAKNHAINKGTVLEKETIFELVVQLFKSSQPEYTPTGKKIFHIVPAQHIDQILK